MKAVEIRPNIYWVGAIDWNSRDFHGYSVDKGTTYNAYLLRDEKTVLFDTVRQGFLDELLGHIRQRCQPEDIDYIVVNHVEMDHSGCLPELVELVKPEKIFCSPMGKKAIEEHFHCQGWPLEVVKSGDEISTGKQRIQFLETRMLHWPDSMFSYLPEEKLLISSDAFGLHLASSERFDDQLDPTLLMHHAAKYYANILLLFSPLLQKLLKQVEEMGLEIEMIAPDHGPVWRGEPMKIVNAYKRWSEHENRNKAVVLYDSMWYSTEKMAKAVAAGLQEAGVEEVLLMHARKCHRSDVMTEVFNARYLLVGSATLNNNLMPAMADVLTYMRGLKPKGKIGAAFGSYGWSGEAVKQLQGYLEEIGVNTSQQGLRVKNVPDQPDLEACFSLGKAVVKG